MSGRAIVTVGLRQFLLVVGVLVVVTSAEGADQSKTTARKAGSKNAPAAVAKLPSFDDAKLEARKAHLLWSLSIQFQQNDYPAKTSLDFRDDLSAEGASSSHPNLQAYWPELADLVTRIGIFDDSITYFIYGGKSSTFPFMVANHQGRKCFVVYLASASVYNTLRTPSPKRRAAQVITSHALPTLRELLRDFESSDIEVFAVFVTYGSRDFRDELSTEPETVGILVPKAPLRAFHRAEISDDELLKNGTVLLSDRHTTEFAKVNLELQ